MNIVVGKIGKSILFNPNSWGPTGGDNEAPKYYENLFRRNPNHKFFLLGANDFSRRPLADQQRINEHKNVIDIWGGFSQWRKSNKGVDDKTSNLKYLEAFTKESGVTFDCGILFSGPTGSTNVPGLTTKMREPGVLSKPIEMIARYSAPLIWFLNETKIPYALIVNDPRYFPPNARDIFHWPEVVLSQYEEKARVVQKLDYASAETKELRIPTVYSAMETIFLIGLTRGGSAAAVAPPTSLSAFFEEEAPPVDGKDINFLIVLNEGRPSRYKLLSEAILNDVQDVQVYGKWDPRTIGDDKRFKGSMGFHELQGMLPRVKYTYCIPIKKGWVTSKFWEMAHYGIIPFLHPTYDMQKHLGAPDILYVKDSKELFERIKYLEENPSAYAELRDTIDKMLKDSYYNGEFLNDLTMKVLTKIAKK
jgi:hypothetical protein